MREAVIKIEGGLGHKKVRDSDLGRRSSGAEEEANHRKNE